MRSRTQTGWILITLALMGTPVLAAAAPSPRLERLDAAVAKLEAKGVSVGIDVRDMSGKSLLSHAPARPLVPASTMKLLTSACAFERLGPAWSTRTRFLALETPASDGILRGSLHVEAGGDPLLRGEDLWVAVEALRARTGLARIEGDLVVDTSLFAGPARPGSWPGKEVNDPYDAPQGAFAVGYSSTELIVRPGPKLGAPARIDLFPIRDVVPVRNRVKTGSNTRIRITIVPDEKGPGTLSVSGTIARTRRLYREWIRLADADEGGLSALEQVLRRAGIDLGGRTRIGALPEEEPVLLYEHPSRPLADLVRVVNKYSSNFGAEMLLRHLSSDTESEAKSTQRGLQTLAECAAEWNIPAKQRVLADGSGYSRSNRLSAAALVSVLLHASRQDTWFPEWLASLPRSGEDGSLRRRLRDLPGQVRAKTGSLSGVASLAGFATDAKGERFAFAIILNGPRGVVSGKDVDQLLELLVR